MSISYHSQEVAQAHQILLSLMASSNHSLNTPFMEEVDEEALGISDYHDIIKEPIWLEKMDEKFETSVYQSIGEFVCDFRLMLFNCFRYNGVNSKLGKIAEKFENLFEQKLGVLPYDMRPKTSIQATLDSATKEDEIIDSGTRRRQCSRLFVSGDSRQSTPIKAIAEELEQLNSNSSSTNVEGGSVEERVLKLVDRLRMWEHRRHDAMLLDNYDNWWEEIVTPSDLDVLRYSSEIPEMFHLLCLAREPLRLDEIIENGTGLWINEFEASLVRPRGNRLLAAVATTLLANGRQRLTLGKHPVPGYGVWNRQLRRRVAHWYKIFNEWCKGDPKLTLRKLGIEEVFFQVLGRQSNPMERFAFHELTLYQRIQVLKALVDYSVWVQENLRQGMDRVIEWSDTREVCLGHYNGFDYIRFPRFDPAGALRLYRRSRQKIDDFMAEVETVKDDDSEVVITEDLSRSLILYGMTGKADRKPLWMRGKGRKSVPAAVLGQPRVNPQRSSKRGRGRKSRGGRTRSLARSDNSAACSPVAPSMDNEDSRDPESFNKLESEDGDETKSTVCLQGNDFDYQPSIDSDTNTHQERNIFDTLSDDNNASERTTLKSKTKGSSLRKSNYNEENSQQTLDLELIPDKPSNLETTSDKPSHLETTSDRPSNLETTSKKPSHLETTSDNSTNLETTSDRPSNLETTSDRPSNLKTTSDNPTNLETTSDRPSNLKTTSDNPTNLETTSDNPTNLETIVTSNDLETNLDKPNYLETNLDKPNDLETNLDKSNDLEIVIVKPEIISSKLNEPDSMKSKPNDPSLSNGVEIMFAQDSDSKLIHVAVENGASTNESIEKSLDVEMTKSSATKGETESSETNVDTHIISDNVESVYEIVKPEIEAPEPYHFELVVSNLNELVLLLAELHGELANEEETYASKHRRKRVAKKREPDEDSKRIDQLRDLISTLVALETDLEEREPTRVDEMRLIKLRVRKQDEVFDMSKDRKALREYCRNNPKTQNASDDGISDDDTDDTSSSSEEVGLVEDRSTRLMRRNQRLELEALAGQKSAGNAPRVEDKSFSDEDNEDNDPEEEGGRPRRKVKIACRLFAEDDEEYQNDSDDEYEPPGYRKPSVKRVRVSTGFEISPPSKRQRLPTIVAQNSNLRPISPQINGQGSTNTYIRTGNAPMVAFIRPLYGPTTTANIRQAPVIRKISPLPPGTSTIVLQRAPGNLPITTQLLPMVAKGNTRPSTSLVQTSVTVPIKKVFRVFEHFFTEDVLPVSINSEAGTMQYLSKESVSEERYELARRMIGMYKKGKGGQ